MQSNSFLNAQTPCNEPLPWHTASRTAQDNNVLHLEALRTTDTENERLWENYTVFEGATWQDAWSHHNDWCNQRSIESARQDNNFPGSSSMHWKAAYININAALLPHLCTVGTSRAALSNAKIRTSLSCIHPMQQRVEERGLVDFEGLRRKV